MIDIFLKKYESLLENLDLDCAKVYKNLPQIPCLPKCSDKVVCCKQIFPLNFIEAYYISKGFKKLDRAARRKLERLAKKLAPAIDKKLKENNIPRIYKNTDYGTHDSAHQSFTNALHSLKLDCPFLHESFCLIYPHRNIDCRIHGFGFDKNTGEILGCYRHKEIYGGAENTKKIAATALPHNRLHKEKTALSSETIAFFAGDPVYKHLRYLTSPFTPILKDFSAFDWHKFFNEKIPAREIIPGTYTLIFD